MRRPAQVFSFIIIIFLLHSCSRYNLKDEDRFEGLTKDSIRIYVRIDLPEETEPDEDSKVIVNSLQEGARSRCYVLLKNYIIKKIKDKNRMASAMNLIPDALKNYKFLYRACHDNYCDAFIDFSIKQLLPELENKKSENKTQ